MKVIIDRFEGDYAVVELENGEFADMPKVFVPNAKEGDIVTITVSEDKDRKKRIEDLANELFK